MNGIMIGSAVVKMLSNAGTSAVVSNVFRTFAPADMGLVKRICVGIGSMGASGALALSTDKYWDQLEQELEQAVKRFKEANRQLKEVEEVPVEVEDVKE